MQEEVGVGLTIETADATTQLIELREAEPVGALDDQGVAVRDVESGLDDGRTYEHVVLAGDKRRHDFLQLSGGHLAMTHDDACLG